MAGLVLNDLAKLTKQLEDLISKYIKGLNSTVSTRIEIYDSGTNGDGINPKMKEFVKKNISVTNLLSGKKDFDQNIDTINRMLEKESINEKLEDVRVDEGGLLNYFNFFNNGERVYICFIRFSGFEDNVLSLYKEKAHPFIKETLKYSFVSFLIHQIYADLREGKYEQLKESNREDYLSSKGREFMRKLLADISGEDTFKRSIGIYGNDLFDEFNYISTLNYEGGSVSAKLLLINKSEIDTHINFYIKLEEPISFDQHRRIRKLLETSDKRTFLIGDHEKIYGLGTLRDYELLKDKPIFLIDFIGKFEYKISFVIMKRDVITNIEDGSIENVKWRLYEHPILFIRYGTPNLRENKFSDVKLSGKLQKIFGDKIEQENKDKLVNLVKYAVNQKSGTIVVLTTTETAEKEIDKLENEAIRINRTNLLNKSKYELKNIIERVTCIDGALYLDVKGNCYAIGVILDGTAEKKLGDSSRGARYNSAIRYANKKGLKDNCVIIVISEDGMVDIIPNSEENEEKINQLINQLMDLINKEQFKAALQLIQKKAPNINKSAQIYYLEGFLYDKLQDYDQALIMYSNSIELNKDYASAYNNRGCVYNMKKEYNHAIRDFTKAIELDPNKEIAYSNRAYVYNILEKHEKAEMDYTKALELGPQNEISYKGRGDVYVKLKEYTKAEMDYNEAIKLNKDYQEAISAKEDLLKLIESVPN